MFGILRYGGILFAVYPAFMFSSNFLSYNACFVFFFINQLTVSTVLNTLLTAMMTLRVCAIWGRSRRVTTFLWTCFCAAQSASIVTAVLGCYRVKIQVPVQLPIPGWGSCSWYISDRAAKLIAASNFAASGYEFILVLLALYCFLKHIREGHQSSQLTLKTFFGVIVRDNTIYFLTCFCALVLSAVSYLNNGGYDTPAGYAFEVAEVMFATFQSSVVGPLMMLSIRRYDAEQLRGETTRDFALGTMQFNSPMVEAGTYEEDEE